MCSWGNGNKGYPKHSGSPITFDHNDLPGIMSLWAADEYLGRYGVLAGRKIAVLSNHNFAKEICAGERGTRGSLFCVPPEPVTAQVIKRLASF